MSNWHMWRRRHRAGRTSRRTQSGESRRGSRAAEAPRKRIFFHAPLDFSTNPRTCPLHIAKVQPGSVLAKIPRNNNARERVAFALPFTFSPFYLSNVEWTAIRLKLGELFGRRARTHARISPADRKFVFALLDFSLSFVTSLSFPKIYLFSVELKRRGLV